MMSETRRNIIVMLCSVFAFVILVSCGDAYEADQEIITRTNEAEQDVIACANEAEQDVMVRANFEGNISDYEFLFEAGRDREWEEDVIYLASNFLYSHPLFIDEPIAILTFDTLIESIVRRHQMTELYLLYNSQLRTEFLYGINELIIRIPELEDHEIIMNLSRIIAKLYDDHSWISMPSSKQLPFAFALHYDEQFSEAPYGVPWPHIRAVCSGFSSLINTRILSINGVEIDEIFERLRPLIPHSTEAGFRSGLAFTGQRISFLHNDALRYIGVVGYEEVVPITVRDVSGSIFTVEVPFVNEMMYATIEQHEVDTERLFSLSRPGEHYWFKHFSEENMIFVRISLFWETLGFSSMQFWNQVRNKIIEQSGIDTFVIDLRGNPGGDILTGIAELFSWVQISDNRKLLGDMYIIIDHNSASRSVLEAYLFRNIVEDVILIGSPAAGPINVFHTHGWPTFLPNSGIGFAASSRYILLNPYTETNTLYPDIFVHSTLSDFVNNYDAVIETIRERRTVSED